MMNLRLFIVSIFLWAMTSSCSQDALNSSVSSTRQSGTALTEVASGTMIAKETSHDTMIKKSDAEVIVSAGSLQVDAAISVNEFKSSNSSYIAAELGMAGEEVSSVTVAHVTSTSADALTQPMTVKLKTGQDAGLFAAFFNDPNYFVVYSYKMPDGSMASGVISGTMLTIADGYAIFQVSNFGVFELFRSKRKVPLSKSMASGAMNPFAKEVKVTALSTRLLVTGASLTITGEHFDHSTRVHVLGHKAVISGVNPKALTITVPDANQFGEGQLKVHNRYNSSAHTVFYKGQKNDRPMIASAPSLVCRGVSYYNLAGEQKVGQKICSAADFPHCKGSMRRNCKLTASHVLADAQSINASSIVQGQSIGGVSGTLDPVNFYTPCTADNQVNCRANAAYAAVIPPTASQIRAGVVIAGVTGTLSYPVKQICTANKTGNCKITSASGFLAVDAALLHSGNIRNGRSIAGVTGSYPSSSQPLTNSSGTDLTADTFNGQLASSANFQFYNNEGERFSYSGDSAFKAEHIAAQVSLFGITGSYEKELTAAPGNEWDYKLGYTLAGTAGKVKTNCRNLVLPGQNAVVANNVAGHYTTEPTVNPWGHSRYACLAEGWEFDENCNPASGVCRYTDRSTGLIWRLDGGTSPAYGYSAQAYCENQQHDGLTGWRAPTQKEAMQAAINGITSAFPTSYRQTMSGKTFWTSTKSALQAGDNNAPFWFFHLTSGIGEFAGSSNHQTNVICVR